MILKTKLHPNNRHRQGYDFEQLVQVCPALAAQLKTTSGAKQQLNFFNPIAVKLLNKALLLQHYGLSYWDIPAGYLCPSIPGRADYIHYIADVLKKANHGKMPKGSHITCLDIGVGANAVYPIIGQREYGWSFIGSDIDAAALQHVQNLINKNASLKGKIKLRQQPDAQHIFKNIIQKREYIDVVICNPPFHASAEEAEAGTRRKLKNLSSQKAPKLQLNFGGQSNELWCEGGEKRFIQTMIQESRTFATNCFWFSTLVSKKAHLKSIYKTLSKVGVAQVTTLSMEQGNKINRVVAWTFLNKKQQRAWVELQWKR